MTTVSGTVKDSFGKPIAGIVGIYVDLTNVGKRLDTSPFAWVDTDGNFTITDVPPCTDVPVRQMELPNGYKQVKPPTPSGKPTYGSHITVHANANVIGVEFVNVLTSSAVPPQSVAPVSSAAPVSPVVQSNKLMKLHSWHHTLSSCPNITALPWAFYNTPDPVTEANTIAPQIKTNGDGYLFLWNPCPGFLSNLTEAGLLAGPPEFAPYTARMTTFFQTLKAAGVSLTNVVMDLEPYYDFNWESSQQQWNTCIINMNTAIREAIVQPLWNVYGTDVKAMNWNDAVPISAAVSDENGWEKQPVGPMGDSVAGVSSLSVYLNDGGNPFKYGSYTHDVAWNMFIQNINNLRASGPGATQRPWFAWPTSIADGTPWRLIPNTGEFLTLNLLKHCAAMGVTDGFYFNPNETTKASDDVLMNSFIDEVNNAAYPVASGILPQIAFDADEIVTGNVITKYIDFVSALKTDNQVPNPKNP